METLAAETGWISPCIGPAVNLAARIEKLTSELRRTILASDEFAGHCASHLVPVGEFELRGFGGACAVFGLQRDIAHADSLCGFDHLRAEQVAEGLRRQQPTAG